MNWDDLRYFLALARARTVSAAGRDLKVKHTTVSRRIKAFEQGLETRLFDHLVDGYSLTTAGENLYQHALLMEEQAHAVERQVFGLDGQLNGSLVLTAAQDVFSRLVVPHLGSFRKTYPAIDLQLLTSAGLADLGARQADIALRLTPKPPDYLVGRKVMQLGIGIYASQQYLRKNPGWNHLVSWNDDIEKPPWAQQHFSDAEIVIRVNDVNTLLDCMRTDMGIAMLPCYIGDSTPQLRRLDLPIQESSWGVWVLSHVDLRATARVRACREFLIDILEQQSTLISGSASKYWQSQGA